MSARATRRAGSLVASLASTLAACIAVCLTSSGMLMLSATEAAAQDQTFAIVGGTVHTLAGSPISGATVVIEAGPYHRGRRRGVRPLRELR